MTQGGDTGRVPNIHWNAIPLAQLRTLPAFHALPPVDSLFLPVPSAYRYVRQDDALWDALHAGVLTTGHLPAALGFYEPECVKRLGVPRDRASHGAVVAACAHLQQPRYVPEVHAHIDAAAAEAHNADAVRAFNCSSSGGGATEHALATDTNGDTSTTRHGRRQRTPRPQISQVEAARRLKVARAAGQQGITAVRCAWGTAQEPASLLALASALPDSRVREAGLCALAAEDLPAAWGFEGGTLPPLGASPDAFVWHGEKPEAESSSSDGEPTHSLTERLGRLGLCAGNINGAAAHGLAFEPGTDGAVWWEETVEVKNSCPFAAAGRSRHGGSRYVVADRGPRQAVPPVWVPQLQFQMLCAGTASGLLFTRSATRGCKLFRLHRDDAYLRQLLTIVARLYRDHVIPGRPPPRDTMWRWSGHAELITATKRLARQAEVVAVVEGGSGGEGDDRFFLE